MKLKYLAISTSLAIALAQVSAKEKSNEHATKLSLETYSYNALLVNNKTESSVRSHFAECLRQYKDCMADPGIDSDLCSQMYIDDCLLNP
ncbi:hypothetical protein [Aliikangiella coralliicola]|uniref:Uncharacterized protein n=1 Tax=Aliikangiella coralliicola TaxID=2592383 RepID=A0A545U8L8_9GAMM|nr:hypothetical protein [Aliikangiella coralliicola]TQV85817.1 hypothetical protein FLL46_17990 [Aliikangiella coralliicola]